MNYRQQWFTAAPTLFVLLGGFLFHNFMAKPVLASSTDDDDVRTLTQIAMNESRVTGVNPESLAMEEKRLADNVTVVTPTGLVKHVQRDALLALVREETGDARVSMSIEVSDVHVHLYGDAAVVTYQKLVKELSPEGPLATSLIGHPISIVDTFVKRDGQWKVVATVGVSQSSLPDELYKVLKTAQLDN